MLQYSPVAKFSLFTISLLQAFGIAAYCSFVGWIMWNANTILGKPNSFIGPAAFLLLFITSAVICASLFLIYPFHLFWNKKQVPQALRLIIYTTAWLAAFAILFISSFALKI